jgi:hypothetical protein
LVENSLRSIIAETDFGRVQVFSARPVGPLQAIKTTPKGALLSRVRVMVPYISMSSTFQLTSSFSKIFFSVIIFHPQIFVARNTFEKVNVVPFLILWSMEDYTTVVQQFVEIHLQEVSYYEP